jgi:Bifunctional DNA primase/polymerase, N-terminal
MNLRSAATFPCNLDKRPISQRGFHDAIRGVDWRRAPLVGFPTGAVNGIDALDVDGDAGRDWYDRNFDAIPQTRAHSTRRGMHLLFCAAPGLRCTESKLAKGVDVRAEGGYVIWWPREGFPVEDAPISEWPDWLLEAAMLAMRKGKAARRSEGDLRTSISEQGVAEHVGDGIAVESIRAALDQLNPCAFEGDRERWVAFMNGAKAIGVPMELFAEWTSRNPAYERNDDEIERNWHSVRGLHAGAFYAELKAAGIKFTRSTHVPHKERSPEVPLRADHTFQPSLNRESRFINLVERLKKDGREDLLFWTACELAGMVLIEGWPRAHVARGMLEEACRINGLRAALKKADGVDGCKQTIANAFAHVANKLKEPQ